MSKLTLKNIYKVYEGGVRAVKDFNLEINDKEFIVFVGPSGCGKSTTLRMIAGLEEITAGDLYIDDVLVNDIEPKDRNIAMVFQNYALYPHMSVFQNMAFGLKLRKLPPKEIEERVNRAANILGITDLLTRKPKALSGGQRQRVALGRAIVREPNVFLLDEPLSNLDAKLRVQMRTEITKLHTNLETTFIYVTHDQTEAMTMGDRIVVMKDGLIQQVDTPITLYEEPVNAFVATFLGSPQMNIFNVKLIRDLVLSISFGNTSVPFPILKEKQLLDEKYIDQIVKFGIRPEDISLSSEGIEAVIDQIEHLGSETIIYAKIEGIDSIVTAKIPSNNSIKANDNIHLSFNMQKAHLFDIENDLSIMGMPEYNVLPCQIDNKKIIMNNTILSIDEAVLSSFFDFTSIECSSIQIPTNKISLIEIPDSFKVDCKVDFKIEGNDYDVLYTTCPYSTKYFVVKVKHSSIKENDQIIAYVAYKDIVFTNDQQERINSKEIIHPNVANCHVSTKNGKTTINIKGQKLIYDDLKITDGDYNFELQSDKVEFLYSKKYAKKNKLEYMKKSNTLHVSAYDEDILGKKNALFVKIDGFDHYVTLVVDNIFSVYKMPEFDIEILKDSFKLYK